MAPMPKLQQMTCERYVIIIKFKFNAVLGSVAQELEKLQIYREKLIDSNQQYINSHPEIRSLLDNFVGAIMVQKPNDLVKFGFTYFNNLRKNDQLGPCPVVISGPSGVGKGTLIDKLLKKFPNLFGFSVSHTTRLPRQGEVDGTHYHFVTKEEFEEAVERGDFIEYAKVHTNYYGTSFHAVEKVTFTFFFELYDAQVIR